MSARPFLKWFGGKAGLADEILSEFPSDFDVYVEPFVGGGAVLFRVLQAFPQVRAVINDANPVLVDTYRAVRNDPRTLVEILHILDGLYKRTTDKEALYLSLRDEFNSRPTPALLIFLNKTCFNGLYRVNKSGRFNVPFGKRKNPTICDTENLYECSKLLRRCEILCGDFTDACHVPELKKAVYYFDPPYKPISKTANFTAYTAGKFCNADQIRLRDLCRELDVKGRRWIVSNSDPRSGFSRELYKGFKIRTVSALRTCAQNASSRGYIGEPLISNGTTEPELLAQTSSPASPETDLQGRTCARGNPEGTRQKPLSRGPAKACPPLLAE